MRLEPRWIVSHINDINHSVQASSYDRTFACKAYRKFYGRYHDLINRYGVSVSQMTTDMFSLS